MHQQFLYENAMAAPCGHVAIPTALKPGPRTYALACSGDCCEPEYSDGDTLVCDPDATCGRGDFVAVWWRDGSHQPQIKRLVLALPPRDCWHLVGDAAFMLVVEQLNPPKQLWAPLRKVEAVHKVIYRIPAATAPTVRYKTNSDIRPSCAG